MVAELLTFAATAAERTSMTDARKQTWCDGIGKNIEEDQMVLLVSRINDENGGTEGEQPAREDEHGESEIQEQTVDAIDHVFQEGQAQRS